MTKDRQANKQNKELIVLLVREDHLKTFMSWLVVGCFAVMVGTPSVSAQERPVAGIVAVLDVAKVFERNLEFDQKMQIIRQEAERLKNTVQSTQEQIRLDAQQLQGMDPTSAQAKQLEMELEQRQGALRASARQSEADLLVREAQAYHETYQKMQSIVAAFSVENGISMVLRFDSSAIDPENRGDVIKGVNRAVIYHKDLDLTKWIIERMGPQVADKPGTNLK